MNNNLKLFIVWFLHYKSYKRYKRYWNLERKVRSLINESIKDGLEFTSALSLDDTNTVSHGDKKEEPITDCLRYEDLNKFDTRRWKKYDNI